MRSSLGRALSTRVPLFTKIQISFFLRAIRNLLSTFSENDVFGYRPVLALRMVDPTSCPSDDTLAEKFLALEMGKCCTHSRHPGHLGHLADAPARRSYIGASHLYRSFAIFGRVNC